jgi:hypothetical protein
VVVAHALGIHFQTQRDILGVKIARTIQRHTLRQSGDAGLADVAARPKRRCALPEMLILGSCVPRRAPESGLILA